MSDRARFERLDATTGLPEQYDLITTFDVIHDTADPRGALRAIRQALKPDGIYLCVETNGSARLEENVGTVRRSALWNKYPLLHDAVARSARRRAGNLRPT